MITFMDTGREAAIVFERISDAAEDDCLCAIVQRGIVLIHNVTSAYRVLVRWRKVERAR